MGLPESSGNMTVSQDHPWAQEQGPTGLGLCVIVTLEDLYPHSNSATKILMAFCRIAVRI